MNATEQHQLFEVWIREHGAIIYHVVNGFAEGDDRNDLLQEILLSIWKAIPSFRHQAKTTTFLYRVCHNAALLWRRTQSNYRRRVERAERFGWLYEETSTTSGTHREEQLSKIYSAIRELSPPDRSLILLSLDGLSYREMAEVHGLSESNVGARLNRIKQRLTQTLKEKIMTFDELQQAWNSPENEPGKKEREQLARQFIKQMHRRRLIEIVWLTWTFLALTAVTILAFLAIQKGKTNIETEWSLIPLLIIPWLFTFHFLRKFRTPSALCRGDIGITDSLRAALASNQAEQTKLKTVGGLFVIILPVLGLAIRQLHIAGKISGHELVSMITLFAGVLLLSAGGIAVKYFYRLRPQQKQLENLLRSDH